MDVFVASELIPLIAYPPSVFPSRRQITKAVRNPTRAAEYLLKPRYRDATVGVSSRIPLGTHILKKNWEVCIILDTCRVDALQEVASEYEFIGEVDKIWSLGGSSPEWMVHTFDSAWQGPLSDTAYLTSNAWAERVLVDRLNPGDEYSDSDILDRLRRVGDWDPIRPAELGRLERIWEYVSEDQEIDEQVDPRGLMPGGAPPRYVTDRAISVARNHDYDRLILHYMQPHAPYLAEVRTTGRGPYEYEKRPFDYIRETGDRDTVWNAYLEELRYVLDDVRLLLNNIDANHVVISADHGEAFGEYGVLNHHTGSLHPHIRFVPWMKTSATNSGSYTPQVNTNKRNHVPVEEQLEALGYRS